MTFAEYIWLDGAPSTQDLRSKARLAECDHDKPVAEDFPEWSFDGSSAEQAAGGKSRGSYRRLWCRAGRTPDRLHETCAIDDFKIGNADQGASIRIPLSVEHNGCGYFEDRRPGANTDPYRVAACRAVTVCDTQGVARSGKDLAAHWKSLFGYNFEGGQGARWRPDTQLRRIKC